MKKGRRFVFSQIKIKHLWGQNLKKIIGAYCFIIFLSGFMYAQKPPINLQVNDFKIEDVIQKLRQEHGYKFLFNHDEIKNAGRKTLNLQNVSVTQVMEELLAGTGFNYKIENDMIVITPPDNKTEEERAPITITGSVKDSNKDILPGVSIRLKGSSTIGAVTDVNGNFKLSMPYMEKPTLIFSFIGMKTEEVIYTGQQEIHVEMQEESSEIEEVIVTGIFERKSESFTGSVATYKTEDLKKIGSLNILQSLTALDPSFNLMTNDQYGSNPNILPEIEIRGKTTIPDPLAEYTTNPNLPLFILDGFQTNLQTILDLNINRVATVTLLKDAASTAIYGSDAAAGVVVIETVKPHPGEVRITYGGDFSVSWADLSDYNLMNAAEKLEFEKRAGVYVEERSQDRTDGLKKLYNERLRRIQSGTDYYWLDKPLRTAFTHKHNVFISGGDEILTYGVGVNYGNTHGVMKKSQNETTGLVLDLSYRTKKIRFSNKLTYNFRNFDNEPVVFSAFSRANPYYDEVAANPENKFLENVMTGNYLVREVNPHYNASLNYLDRGGNRDFRDNFYVEWNPMNGIKVTGRFSYLNSEGETEKFISPFHTDFETTKLSEKGSYTKSTTRTQEYSGDMTLTYYNVINQKHMINLAGTFKFMNREYTGDSYKAIGFADDKIPTPDFAHQYALNTHPSYRKSVSRNLNYFLNGGYMYDRRYAVDFTIRQDGTNNFGSNNLFTTTWSTGIAWNLHHENFIGEWADHLKLRYTIGEPGNSSNQYQTETTYSTNTKLNAFGNGTYVNNFSNNDLNWEKVLDQNLGLEFTGFGKRYSLTAEFFRREADPMVATVYNPLSTGRTRLPVNIGKNTTKGITFSANVNIINKPGEFMWGVGMSGRHTTSKLSGLGNTSQMNEAMKKNASLKRFFNGASMDDIWAVRSGGIDPVTGNEIFIKKDNTYSMEFEADDEVVVGNTNPDLEGRIHTNFNYKGFSISIYLRYVIGGTQMNTKLYDKVEGLSRGDVFTQNQDKRALTDRWSKVGDIAKFRRITDLEGKKKLTDRFLQKENGLYGESLSVGYDFVYNDWIRKLSLTGLSVRCIFNDIFRWSSIREERGIDYPFERRVTFSLNMMF